MDQPTKRPGDWTIEPFNAGSQPVIDSLSTQKVGDRTTAGMDRFVVDEEEGKGTLAELRAKERLGSVASPRDRVNVVELPGDGPRCRPEHPATAVVDQDSGLFHTPCREAARMSLRVGSGSPRCDIGLQ